MPPLRSGEEPEFVDQAIAMFSEVIKLRGVELFQKRISKFLELERWNEAERVAAQKEKKALGERILEKDEEAEKCQANVGTSMLTGRGSLRFPRVQVKQEEP